jgi:hypothetical protein
VTCYTDVTWGFGWFQVSSRLANSKKASNSNLDYSSHGKSSAHHGMSQILPRQLHRLQFDLRIRLGLSSNVVYV